MLNLWKKSRGVLLVSLGYMLSPLSWWNDLVFNLPIALVFGYGVAWVNADWFLGGTIMGYWLSNVIGIVMMQFGAMDVFFTDGERNVKRDLWMGFGGSTLYTVGIFALVYFKILQLPDFLLDLHF